MVVRQIGQSQFTIDVPGFEHLRFTESSKEYLTLPPSVQFAAERGSTLQSAREAWAFRIGANGILESSLYQSTRTAALGVKIDGDYYIAIDDSPDPASNILLARAQEGYDAHYTTGEWLVHKNDPLIRDMLARAEHGGRVFCAPEKALVLPTTPRNGPPGYGAHQIPQAILGQDLATHVANYLNQHGYKNGYVWTLSPSDLDQIGVDNDHIEVRRVGVGGSNIYGIHYLDADVQCNSNGRARGVRENSTRNKG